MSTSAVSTSPTRGEPHPAPDRPWRVARLVSWSLVGLVSIATLLVGVALVAGYRPVVVTTGSMGRAAPPGSLVVASPTDAVAVGDILVMRREGSPTITHRVLAIDREAGAEQATTKGDANPAEDPQPYQLGDDELVARWVIPRLGAVITQLGHPVTRAALVAVAAAMLVATVRLRGAPEPAADSESSPRS